jgi:hypothetical protein
MRAPTKKRVWANRPLAANNVRAINLIFMFPPLLPLTAWRTLVHLQTVGQTQVIET